MLNYQRVNHLLVGHFLLLFWHNQRVSNTFFFGRKRGFGHLFFSVISGWTLGSFAIGLCMESSWKFLDWNATDMYPRNNNSQQDPKYPAILPYFKIFRHELTWVDYHIPFFQKNSPKTTVFHGSRRSRRFRSRPGDHWQPVMWSHWGDDVSWFRLRNEKREGPADAHDFRKKWNIIVIS